MSAGSNKQAKKSYQSESQAPIRDLVNRHPDIDKCVDAKSYQQKYAAKHSDNLHRQKVNAWLSEANSII